MTTLERLKRALARREVVVVTGTGISTALGSGQPQLSWIGLLKDGVQRIADRNSARADVLSQQIEIASSAADLAAVAAEVKRHLGDDFGRWISIALGDIKPSNQRLANAIAALDCPILTTNYDTLLETALGRDSVSWAQPTSIRDVVRHARPSIGHLHGVWSDPSSLVFSTSDYEALLRQEGAQEIQSSAFTMKTFLFVGVGAGLDDPNFSPMVDAYGRHFHAADGSHFRLCRDADVDAATDVGVVADVGYGTSHDDLAAFLEGLVASIVPDRSGEVLARSRAVLVDQLRDNSALWRDDESILVGGLTDLIVEPIFLPAPHDQFVNDSALVGRSSVSEPLDADQLIDQGGIVLVAGEASAGVTTAVIWLLDRASERKSLPPVLVSEPHAAGHHPVSRVVERSLKSWDCDLAHANPVVVGVDNLRREPAKTYRRALADVHDLNGPLKVVGVRQEDALEIAAALQASDDGVAIAIAFLGRFSDREALALASRIAPAKGEEVAQAAMEMVRSRNLPRTPVTITLVIELLAAGIALEDGDTDSWVLSKYLDLLLEKHLPPMVPQTTMLLRNKRVALEEIASGFVETRTDSARREELTARLEALFTRLGWDFDAVQLLNELIARQVLKRREDGSISFQRSVYLELSAGMAARKNEALRQAMLDHPIEMAPIVRSYVAMTRSDEAMLEVVDRELDRIFNEKPTGNIFASVKQQPARKELFADRGEPEEGEDQNESEVARDGLMYDASDDSDSPAFLQGHLDELSGGRLAMLVVDLASRVLRDSDEVPNQELKQRVLIKLLHCWSVFTDLYEADLRELPNLDETVARLHPEDEPSPEQVEDLKTALVSVVPMFLTLSGMRTCLAAASLHRALSDVALEDGSTASLMRVLALYASDSRRWVAALNDLDDAAARTFFGASFLASLARYSFLADDSLTDGERAQLRAFLRRIVQLRYRFNGVQERNEALNRFEQRLRQDRLARGRTIAIEV
ncbi:SIR2 family NAD-dependent protein deacylase [Agrococcus pavilionensis]|uniref:SIR2 family NAD-dependent protein deacylase n=1 Tax=Agrococcus pavilionensis TaxID=1346502 RepID=UPI00130EC669|nr:SIR2 family protein [Agrococcus pavilionensis]